MSAPSLLAPQRHSLPKPGALGRPKSLKKSMMSVSRRGSAPSKLSGNNNTNWQSASAAELPAFYPLSDSHTVLRDADVAVSEVASRISECLRLRSISAKFSTYSAKCKTLDRCEFEITMFQDKANGDAIVVEVHHLRGDAAAYRTHSDAILNAAEGLDFLRETRDLSASILDAAKPSGYDSDTMFEVLENTCELIQKDRIDASLIGMETLCILTKAERVGLKCASITSRAVLLGEVEQAEVDAQHPLTQSLVDANSDSDMDADEDDDIDELGMKSVVLSLVRDRRLQPGDEDASSDDPAFAWHIGQMRLLALNVLDNALNIMVKRSKNMQRRIVKKMMENEMMETMVRDLSEVEENTHEAYLSVRVLSLLSSMSEAGQESLMNAGAIAALERALVYGQRYHTLLAQVSAELLNTIRNDSLFHP